MGLSTSEKVKLVDNSAAFLARILILMKHSGINLNCMMGSDGDSFIYFVNKVCFVVDKGPPQFDLFACLVFRHILRKM